MSFLNLIKAQAATWLIERPASRLGLAELREKLAENGRQIEARLAQAQDTPANRESLCHVVGIERWGQARLRVALGEPLVKDEYDAYCPDPGLDWEGLQAAFQAARQETLALARQLEEAGAAGVLVPHNDFGDLSVRGWLFYLDMHAKLESRRISGPQKKRAAVTSGTVVPIPVQPWLNVFVLKGEEGAVLVDAGLPGQADLILERAAEHGVSPQGVRLILITHGHADHFGSAAELRQRTGAPVAVHALDAESLQRGSHQLQEMQASNRLVGLVMKIPGAQLAPDAPALEPDILFEEDWRLDEYGVAGQVIHTPGHSPGSVSVLLDSGELIVGDMVMGGLMGLLPRPGDPIIAWDMARNRESIRRVQALAPRVVYASHGGPFEDLSPVWQEGPDRRALALALGALAGLVLFVWLLWRRRGPAD